MLKKYSKFIQKQTSQILQPTCRYLQQNNNNQRNFPKQHRAYSNQNNTIKQQQSYNLTFKQFSTIIVINGIFFFIFGTVDNGLMIILGDKIDATVAVTLSMSTLASAALGNAFSNGVGIMIGSLFEMLNIIPKINIHASLEKNKQSNICQKKIGTFFGMIIGCLFGMVPLLFMNTKKAEIEKRQKNLNKGLFNIVTEKLKDHFNCDGCEIFLQDTKNKQYYKLDNEIHEKRISDEKILETIERIKQKENVHVLNRNDQLLNNQKYGVGMSIKNKGNTNMGTIFLQKRNTKFNKDNIDQLYYIINELSFIISSQLENINSFIAEYLNLSLIKSTEQKFKNHFQQKSVQFGVEKLLSDDSFLNEFVQPLFNEIDIDKNDVIDQDELLKFYKKHFNYNNIEDFNKIYSLIDINNDKQIEQNEFFNFIKQSLKALNYS